MQLLIKIIVLTRIGQSVHVLNQGMQSRDSCVQWEQAPALRYCIQEP